MTQIEQNTSVKIFTKNSEPDILKILSSENIIDNDLLYQITTYIVTQILSISHTIRFAYIEYLITFYDFKDLFINTNLIKILRMYRTSEINYIYREYKKSRNFLEFLFLHFEQPNLSFDDKLTLISKIVQVLNTEEDKKDFCKLLQNPKNKEYSLSLCDIVYLYKYDMIDCLTWCVNSDKFHFLTSSKILPLVNSLIDNKNKNVKMTSKTIYNFIIFSWFYGDDYIPNEYLEIIFDNYMFTSDDLNIINLNNRLCHYVINKKLYDVVNININDEIFYIMMLNDKYDQIYELFEKNIMIQNANNQNNKLIFQKIWEHKIILNDEKTFKIYKYFVNLLNNASQSHLQYFLEKQNTNLCDFLINEKNIVIDEYMYNTYVTSSLFNNNIYQKYFKNSITSHENLLNACACRNIYVIRENIDNKIVPTQKCYLMLFNGIDEYLNAITYLSGNNVNLLTSEAKIQTNTAYRLKTQLKINLIPEIVNILIHGGLELNHSDIILATKYNIELQNNIFTKNFVPDDDFYHYCTKNFCPLYNDNIFKNQKWLYNHCKCVTTMGELKKIKSYVKKYNLVFDMKCKNILLNQFRNHRQYKNQIYEILSL